VVRAGTPQPLLERGLDLPIPDRGTEPVISRGTGHEDILPQGSDHAHQAAGGARRLPVTTIVAYRPASGGIHQGDRSTLRDGEGPGRTPADPPFWRVGGASGGPVLNVQNRPFWRADEARGVIKFVPGSWGWPATWLVSQPRITPVRCPGLARRLPGQPGPASRAVCPVPASGASLPPPAARGLLAALAGPPGVARRAVVRRCLALVPLP
jgi:hypothetical protein